MAKKSHATESQVVPIPAQPDMKPFQVLQRTDGLWILYNEHNALGGRTVFLAKRGTKLDEMIDRMKLEYEKEFGSVS
jgi:hypothetical protein